MARKKSFILYTDSAKQVALLSDAQAGLLFKAILEYARTGEEGSFSDGMVNMLYSILTSQMARDAAKYEEICEKRRENARKGGKAKAAKWQQKLHDTENDTVTVNDTENDTVTVSDTETVSDTVCDTDTEPVSECVCDPVHEPDEVTTHNTTAAAFSIQDALALAELLGYHWDQTEAAHFLAYNLGKGRTDGWRYAVQRWEMNRPKYAPGRTQTEDCMSPEEIAYMNECLSLVNRFREDEESA